MAVETHAIDKGLLKDQVYRKLLQKITQGDYVAGDRLVERTIADEFGVSLTPVREALIRMEADHIIAKEPRKGFFVKKYSDQEIQQVYEVIFALECAANIKAMDYCTPEDLVSLEKMVDQMEDALNEARFHDFFEINGKIHTTFVQLSQNPFLLTLFEKMIDIPIPIFYFSEEETREETLRKSVSEHREWLKCFRNQDVKNLRVILAKQFRLERSDLRLLE